MREKTTPRPVARPAKPVGREASRPAPAARPRLSAPRLRLPGGGIAGVQGRTQGFIRETRSELKKVVWPSRDEAIRLTLIVIGVSVAIGLMLGLVDYMFQIIFEVLLTG